MGKPRVKAAGGRPRWPTCSGRVAWRAVSGRSSGACDRRGSSTPTRPAGARRATDLIVSAKRGIFLWAMGLTQHRHGTDNILSLANLALARGWLGRPGSGLLPIRGHGNVQEVSASIVDIRAGNLAMYYPEANAIVPRRLGTDTGTPAFKSVAARVRRAGP